MGGALFSCSVRLFPPVPARGRGQLKGEALQRVCMPKARASSQKVPRWLPSKLPLPRALQLKHWSPTHEDEHDKLVTDSGLHLGAQFILGYDN